ncbi:MAG: penicillin-binding transpeptidase domain-containing protein [Anaerovoracaceae bacterium]
MKKITSRTVVCLFLALLLLIGTSLFTFRFVKYGGSWVSYPSNRHVYENGVLKCGRILDRNGEILAAYDKGWKYNDKRNIREATLHSVGDPSGVIGTGAIGAFADKLTGYNLITGTSTMFSNGRDLYLTLDADLCSTAYKALNGHNGTVGVYNYKTGEIICLVSSRSYDPELKIDPDDKAYDGVYINRLTAASFAPGSTFKLITSMAALEEIPDIKSRTFTCTGREDFEGTAVTCSKAHGRLSFEEALNVSCNCTFARIATELGSSAMKKYTKQAGLTNSYSINGISTKRSSFDFDADGIGGLAWSGVGQGRDLVNPASMMIFCGAVANDGKAAIPQIIDYTAFREGVRYSIYIRHYTDELINPQTAASLKAMMRSNVTDNYGEKNFPGLNICAKSGTAQTDGSALDNAWFAGFLDDEYHPLAFIVLVEEGGAGASVAGPVANKVLQQAVKAGY